MPTPSPILVCLHCGQQVAPEKIWRLPTRAGELECCPDCCCQLVDLEQAPQKLDDELEIHPAALKEAEEHEIPPAKSEEDFSQVREDEGEMFI